MRQSQLLQLLEKLDRKDLREARKWVASPAHNLRADVLAMFDHLTAALAKSPDRLSKEQAFAACCPGEAYDEARANHIMSWLLECLRDYLGWREWQSDQPAVRLLRCRALRKIGLDDAFEKEWEAARAALEAQPCRDEHYHHQSHLLQRERYEHASLQRRAADLPLSEMADHAATAYRLNSLRFECSAQVAQSVARRGMSNVQQGTPNVQPSDTAVHRPPSAVTLYENLLLALRDPTDEAAFFEAKRLLEENWPLFRGNERRDIYLLALNYCIRKINGGQRQFLRQALDLYRSGLDNQALFEYGQISRFTYKNAVTAGLNLGEFDWARQFIEDYRQHLHPRERHSAHCYNLAVWHFWRLDYDQAMTLLRETDFADPLTNLDARAILAKIYHARGYHDALDSHLESFQTYLRRQKNIGYQRDNYLNLIRFTKKLLRLEPKDEAGRAALREEIGQTAALAEREWLLGKL
jgi:hypothetical protein